MNPDSISVPYVTEETGFALPVASQRIDGSSSAITFIPLGAWCALAGLKIRFENLGPEYGKAWLAWDSKCAEQCLFGASQHLGSESLST